MPTKTAKLMNAGAVKKRSTKGVGTKGVTISKQSASVGSKKK